MKPSLFTLKNAAIRKWLLTVAAVGAGVPTAWPPSFWLCGIGLTMLVFAILANATRTGQWMSWQMEGSLTWFEGWAASTGALLVILPLIAILIRSWVQ